MMSALEPITGSSQTIAPYSKGAISKNCDDLKIAMVSWEGKKKAATHEER
jgi:hypothetical protein